MSRVIFNILLPYKAFQYSEKFIGQKYLMKQIMSSIDTKRKLYMIFFTNFSLEIKVKRKIHNVFQHHGGDKNEGYVLFISFGLFSLFAHFVVA